MTNKNQPLEIWKDIPEYENIYKVSNFGRVRSLDRLCVSYKKNGEYFYRRLKGKIMKLAVEDDFYLRISLTNLLKIRDRVLVHRLVALAFIPNPENKPFVNHKNGIKNDNCVENLEWCTESENSLHAYKIGLSVSVKGSSHGRSKLTEKQVLEIREIGRGMFQKDIAILYNIERTSVTDILNRKSWTHI